MNGWMKFNFYIPFKGVSVNESCGDNTVLDRSQPPEEDLQPILREEVEIAVASLKKGKSAGVDNIPAELVQAGRETMIDVLTEICNRIWRTGEWPTPWTQSLIITLPKKGNLQLCQNYRTISLISHSSKVMLKVILNRLKPQAEEIIAEEEAGLRAGRSTTEQIFNLRILCEKYLQHQQNLYHVFIDFKKAFGRVWHAALWATMRKYNISANLVRTIEQLYDKATSAVQMNGSIGEWFRATVGVRQGCLLSPTLFNIFLERIMSDALEEHDGKVSIGSKNITNLRFADDIDALAEEEQELEALVESLDKTCTRYKMEISAEKTKLMTNSANGIQREIKVKGQKLGTVTSFKYLGAVVSLVGWLFWVKRPFETVFQSISSRLPKRGRKRRERIDESKNVQTTPTRTYCKCSRPLPYCHPNCRTPRHWKFTQHHRTTRPSSSSCFR